MQLVMSASCTERKKPAAQASHCVLTLVKSELEALFWPTGHMMQEEEAVVLAYLPTVQEVHEEALEPTASLNWPSGHAVHSGCPDEA